jgi:serine kinase of HPr protein (carbohydrate metabolism regulator)
MIVHATAIARRVERDWRAALLFGKSGSGKSDLALRAISEGWRLVSDDYSVVWASGGRLWARAPDTIADQIEARGIGVFTLPRLDLAPPVAVAVHCETGPIERMPDPEAMNLEGIDLSCIRLHALEASALFKLDRVVSTRGEDGFGAV